MYKLGIDVGSTTVKTVLLDEANNILYKKYSRHNAKIKSIVVENIQEILNKFGNISIKSAITGSAGMGISFSIGINFVQEVIASTKAILNFFPNANTVIELGGEDAKIIFLGNSIEQRMNGTCAGGTGAFLDQMATLLDVSTDELNTLASKHKKIYQIASRCGVFAKSDIQPLLNQGASKEDLAASILQAVVNQTIAGLAQGKKIEGNVVFIGGPLTFLSELRNRFIKTLSLKDENVIFPENAEYYPAIGSAMEAEAFEETTIEDILNSIIQLNTNLKTTKTFKPLFNNEAEYLEFKKRHSSSSVKKIDIEKYNGNAYLGIDAGSTTTKIVMISENNEILYEYYASNRGNPIEVIREQLIKITKLCKDRITIKASAATGYGEELIMNAFRIDFGQVETVAHYKAASFFNPLVDYIIDIGGQDMKCCRIKNSAIDSILLNEACSSGCGSFIETFAKALGYTVSEFADLALFAKNPVDLGSRCTVFMNSSVKQAQKEGASIEDISAGLAISVVKNALYKVIRINNPSELGKNVVVQGGTFYNDAILKAFEDELEINVTRPSIAGMMGAFGCALIAKENAQIKNIDKSNLLTLTELENFKYSSTVTTCKICGNNCTLTINNFGNGTKYISGNKCEKPTGRNTSNNNLPNLFQDVYKKLISLKTIENPKRGNIGIPLALNIYDTLPFWIEFFNNLSIKVVLSSQSSHDIYMKGYDTIPSDTACYPAKLVHGHIIDLIDKGIEKIFYPIMPYNFKEKNYVDNHYNCPVVAYYPELIHANVSKLNEVQYLMPYFAIHTKRFPRKAFKYFCKYYNLTLQEVNKAYKKAIKAYKKFKLEIRNKALQALEYAQKNNIKTIVLAGRPYHIDPEINHGIDKLISSFGMIVLTEESVSSLSNSDNLDILNQWTYHSRLYDAAAFVTTLNNTELVHLVSFGCGIDAITSDETHRILESKGKLYTQIKIDEISNLGAAKIRIRSLIAAMEEKEKSINNTKNHESLKPIFTKEMKKKYTILAPQMLPIHWSLIRSCFINEGYNFEVIDVNNQKVIEDGLKYVHNDICYPAQLVIGQFLHTLKSGNYDINKVALMITQTGGGCRASNYIHLLRKALKRAGYSHIPVISLNLSGLERNPGFKLSIKLLRRLLYSVLYGDLLMWVYNRQIAYAKNKSDVENLLQKWITILADEIVDTRKLNLKKVKDNMEMIVNDFDNIEIDNVIKPRVGIVGEIYVKFAALGNNNLEEFLRKEGAEVVLHGLLDFVIFKADNRVEDSKIYGGKILKRTVIDVLIKILKKCQKIMIETISKSKNIPAPGSFDEMKSLVNGYLGYGNKMGEGWLLTAEMLELIHSGVNNIVSAQPFGCLPNHVVAKGMIKKIKENYPQANIVPIDYDPSTTKVNQENRLRLMLSNAKKNITNYSPEKSLN